MTDSVVPLTIRKHLVPFFYKEFQGTEALYGNKKVKACKISMSSSIGFLIRITLEKSDRPIVSDRFNMYIKFSDDEGIKTKEAQLYKCVSGKDSFLQIPQKVNDKINGMLEDQFRIAFVYFVTGMINGNPDMKIRDAIAQFMLEYELDEADIEVGSLWRMLNRSQLKGKLSRMQYLQANRVKKK